MNLIQAALSTFIDSLRLSGVLSNLFALPNSDLLRICNDTFDDTESCFPRVKEGDWCGEFQKNEGRNATNT
jgi:hypothetical protein